jgi:myo-inositol 2-dehydrogenase/D-chiro-inositol 1-dehydrogenase
VGWCDGPNAYTRLELKLQRVGASEAEVVAIEKSGEVFELEEQLRRLVTDVPRRTPLVSPHDALPSLRICLEIERALSERRAISLAWT